MKGKPDPFARHKVARASLAEHLHNYQDKLVPELETVLSAKTLTQAHAGARSWRDRSPRSGQSL